MLRHPVINLARLHRPSHQTNPPLAQRVSPPVTNPAISSTQKPGAAEEASRPLRLETSPPSLFRRPSRPLPLPPERLPLPTRAAMRARSRPLLLPLFPPFPQHGLLRLLPLLPALPLIPPLPRPFHMHARAGPLMVFPLLPLPRISHRIMQSHEVGFTPPGSTFWIWMRMRIWMRMTRLSLLMRRMLHEQGGRAKVAPRPARPRSALMLRAAEVGAPVPQARPFRRGKRQGACEDARLHVRSRSTLRAPAGRRAPSSGSPCGSASGLQAPARRSPSAAPGAAARRRANPPPRCTSPSAPPAAVTLRAAACPLRSLPLPPRSLRGLREPP
nr:MAG TPA: hypothetical protein [Caudoviricetes sp.]